MAGLTFSSWTSNPLLSVGLEAFSSKVGGSKLNLSSSRAARVAPVGLLVFGSPAPSTDWYCNCGLKSGVVEPSFLFSVFDEWMLVETFFKNVISPLSLVIGK